MLFATVWQNNNIHDNHDDPRIQLNIYPVLNRRMISRV